MRMIFHVLQLGDVDDIDIYVAWPIHLWQQTPKGQWVTEHAFDLGYVHRPSMYGYRVEVCGELPDGALVTEYLLRWGDQLCNDSGGLTST